MHQIAAAFEVASVDLGFVFVAHPKVEILSPERQPVGYLPHFGSKSGIYLFALDSEPSEDERHAMLQAFLLECIVGDAYEFYDRKLFAATLNDWQYFGPNEQRPPWYTGEAWS